MQMLIGSLIDAERELYRINKIINLCKDSILVITNIRIPYLKKTA
tara:strand:+ start:440 stop:574 length:135 start_codon:yes stop_codon:yes gene_type:complete